MKNKIVSVLITALALIILPGQDGYAQSGKGSNKKSIDGADSVIKGKKMAVNGKARKKINFSKRDSALIVTTLIDQDSCVRTPNVSPASCPGPNCIQNFCGNQTCIDKIICCHKISENVFNTMTRDRSLGFAPFDRQQVENVVTGASCETQCIKVRKFKRWFLGKTRYSITRVDTADRDENAVQTVYYSIALIEGLLKKYPLPQGIISIAFYSGFDIDDRVVFPFKLNFANGTHEYYDISDSNP